MERTDKHPKSAIMVSRNDMLKTASERVAEISAEFKRGFEFLADYPKTITFFGSNQTKKDSPYYESARTLSHRIVKELGYSVVSGGGPGIMEAADRGAFEAGGNSLGLLIQLPDSQPTNTYLTKSVSFYYFFARKVCLSFGAEVFIFFPGGFGTLDEFFELVTLLQTKKIEGVPLICVGSGYWNKIKDFMKDTLLEMGAISAGDIDLFTITDSHDEIIDIIKKVPIRAKIPFSGVQTEEVTS